VRSTIKVLSQEVIILIAVNTRHRKENLTKSQY